MQTTERPDLAHALLKRAWANSRGDYVSKGNAVVQIKQLTLCLRIPWFNRVLGPISEDDAFDPFSKFFILMGTAFNRMVQGDEKEPRVELLSEVGIASGRIDLIEVEEERTEGPPVAILQLVVPGEVKLTWASDVKPQYVEQVAAYCLALRVLKARVYVARAIPFRFLHPIQCFEYEWTRDELDVYDLELNRRAIAVASDHVPSLADHYTWECKTCPRRPRKECPGGGGKTAGWFDAKPTIPTTKGGKGADNDTATKSRTVGRRKDGKD